MGSTNLPKDIILDFDNMYLSYVDKTCKNREHTLEKFPS